MRFRLWYNGKKPGEETDMPRFDFYVAFPFDDYDGAAKLVRALQSAGRTCFTDSYICEEVLREEDVSVSLDYSDGAVIIIGENSDGTVRMAELAAGIGLPVSLIVPQGKAVPKSIAGYEGLKIYARGGEEWEKAVADAIVKDNPIDEDTARLLKMMSVFEQDNGRFEIEFSLKKLSALRRAAKVRQELVPVYIKGIFESAKLDWNNADKEELTGWWDALTFARENAGSGSLADIRLLESIMYRVRKVLFP